MDTLHEDRLDYLLNDPDCTLEVRLTYAQQWTKDVYQDAQALGRPDIRLSGLYWRIRGCRDGLQGIFDAKGKLPGHIKLRPAPRQNQQCYPRPRVAR